LITLEDLTEAIKECEGQRSPNANTALKLAAFYTIKKELYPETPTPSGYSYAAPPAESVIEYRSETEFGQAVSGKETTPVMAILDDLMSLLQSAQPRLHKRIISKIQDQ